MTEEFSYNTYLSVFTWRYGTPEMRKIFSETKTRAMWRKVWLSLAEAQAEYGIVSGKELADIKSKAGEEHVNLKRAHEIEKIIKHDLMAEVKTYAEQASLGGGKIHLGATSMDIEDNVDVLKIKDALTMILLSLVNCLDSVSNNVVKYRDTVCMGWTHLQPAEPTTVGYRFANYAQDIVIDIQFVEILLTRFVKGKGVKGAVGTSASFKHLLHGKGEPDQLEDRVMAKLGLEAFPVSTQTYPRKLDYLVLSALASIAQSTYKFGFDMRIMQSPGFGEMSEPIGKAQVGSSAMPFKKNPTAAERMCSLSRYVGMLPHVAFSNAANMILERTLDDSANRRLIFPEGFLAVDECLVLYNKIVRGVQVYPQMIKKNLERYGQFAGTEALLMSLVEKGEDRQEMHEVIRQHSFKAWEAVMRGEANPIENMIAGDAKLESVSKKDLQKLLDPSKHIGDAVKRCDEFVSETVKPILSTYKGKIGKAAKTVF